VLLIYQVLTSVVAEGNRRGREKLVSVEENFRSNLKWFSCTSETTLLLRRFNLRSLHFFMLNDTPNHVDFETVLGVVWLILMFLQIITSKSDFWILQVSRDRKRLLTVFVRQLSRVLCCMKGHCLEAVKSNGCTRERSQYSRDLFRAKTLDNWLYCNVGCLIFRNRRRRI